MIASWQRKYLEEGFEGLNKSIGRPNSMSRRGNCIDNSPMENFFGLLIQEMYYGEKFSSIDELKIKIEQYIHWYNNKRIKDKLNDLSPIEYRQHAA